jgi:hypothetical protein
MRLAVWSDRKSFRAAVLGSAALFGTPALAQDAEPDFTLLDRYCVECHNFEEWAGGVAFDTMDPALIHEDAEVWEEAMRKLGGRLMPPPGAEQPDSAELASFVETMEARLDAAAAEAGPRPGYVTLHRLNRTEYENQIKALFDLEVDVEALLPPDQESDGFENVADVLQVSPSFLDQYIGAARDISIRAVGNGEVFADQATYLSSAQQNHNVHQAGLPLGSRGGIRVEHYFPVDGTYELTIGLGSRGGELLRSYPTGWLEFPHTVVMSIDGEPVFEASLGGEEDLRALDQEQQSAVTRILGRFENIPFQIESGSHVITATFVARTLAEDDDLLENQVPGLGLDDVPVINLLDIVGPFNTGSVGDTPSRQEIFSCYPESDAEQRPCAEEIMSRLGEQAYRRPLEHGELQNLMGFYESGVQEGGFETGVQKAVMAMLSSTHFLYRVEEAPQSVAEGEVFALDGPALASRLAFFLWSQGPDEELRQAGLSGDLEKPEVLREQVERMLADPRSKALVENFGFQWLGGSKVETINPDPRIFPNFDEDLREGFREELNLFLDEVLRGGGSVTDLLTANYTFVDERLARHYGIADIQGANFRRIELEDSRRWGLLGKGAVLMATSYPNRTSPVLRGAWILDTLIGAPPAAPPPGVETDLDAIAGGSALTVRTRLEQHRAEESCNSCHGVIDPLGLALENFDAIGAWRDLDRFAGQPIDATGVLVGSNAPISGPADLREALAAEPEHFVQTFTENLMIYALGRRIEYFDMPVVRRIVRETADDDYSFTAIVQAVVESEPFRMNAMPATAEAESAETVDEASLAQPVSAP